MTKHIVNKAAQAMGRLNKGRPKTVSLAERKRRAARLAVARKKRWPAKRGESTVDRRGVDS